jgi:hypothetical protein
MRVAVSRYCAVHIGPSGLQKAFGRPPVSEAQFAIVTERSGHNSIHSDFCVTYLHSDLR